MKKKTNETIIGCAFCNTLYITQKSSYLACNISIFVHSILLNNMKFTANCEQCQRKRKFMVLTNVSSNFRNKYHIYKVLITFIIETSHMYGRMVRIIILHMVYEFSVLIVGRIEHSTIVPHTQKAEAFTPKNWKDFKFHWTYIGSCTQYALSILYYNNQTQWQRRNTLFPFCHTILLVCILLQHEIEMWKYCTQRKKHIAQKKCIYVYGKCTW